MKTQLFYANWEKLKLVSEDILYSVMRGEVADDPSIYEMIWEDDLNFKDTKEACEYVFRMFNISKIDKSVRSMSVGDVVSVDDKFFVCKNIVFEEVADGSLVFQDVEFKEENKLG